MESKNILSKIYPHELGRETERVIKRGKKGREGGRGQGQKRKVKGKHRGQGERREGNIG